MELMKIITKSAFNSNYIEYESKEYKNKNLSITKYLYIIIPYLSDMINHNIIQSEKFNYQWKSIFGLLMILMKFVQCIQKVIT